MRLQMFIAILGILILLVIITIQINSRLKDKIKIKSKIGNMLDLDCMCLMKKAIMLGKL